jgi:cytochrome c556
MRTHLLLAILLTVNVGALATSAGAQTHQHEHPPAAAAAKGTRQHEHSPGAAKDTRQLVRFSEPMRLHTIANMRDHLLALQEINEALSTNAFDKASAIAEQRLGMSSLALHGANELAPNMPKGMQDIGTQMHRAASRLAVEAQNASVGNDVRPALAALGAVMQQCVACHATYRLH